MSEIIQIMIIITISILMCCIFAPLGCLILWKRYVYFGDGLAHASMLSVVLSVIMDIHILYANILNILIFTIMILKLKNKSRNNNAAIGCTSSLMIAVALILSYVFPGKFNFAGLLFGNIITANVNDVIILTIILICLSVFFIASYKNLIITILSADIAYSRGIKINILELLFILIISCAIITTIKITGGLLVTSIILIPAMTARIIAKSPSGMIAYSVFFANLMNFYGIILSYYYDLPFSPMIIVCGGIVYISVSLITHIISSWKA